MSISDLRSRPSPLTVLADAVAAVREVDATWWSHQSDDDLVAVVELVEQGRSAMAAVQAGALAEADARDLGKQRLAYGSTGDWLTHFGGLRKGEGRRLVARAHARPDPWRPPARRWRADGSHPSTPWTPICLSSPTGRRPG